MTGGQIAIQAGEERLSVRSRQLFLALQRFLNPSTAARLEANRVGGGQPPSTVRVGRFIVRLDEDRAKTRARSIGAIIQAQRTLRGWSQEELARKCGMARANLARLESGRHEPLLSSLERVAAALGVQVSALLAKPSARSAKEDARWIADGVREWGTALSRLDREK